MNRMLRPLPVLALALLLLNASEAQAMEKLAKALCPVIQPSFRSYSLISAKAVLNAVPVGSKFFSIKNNPDSSSAATGIPVHVSKSLKLSEHPEIPSKGLSEECINGYIDQARRDCPDCVGLWIDKSTAIIPYINITALSVFRPAGNLPWHYKPDCAKYPEQHLSLFDNGAVALIWDADYENYFKSKKSGDEIGAPDGMFVMPKFYFDDLVRSRDPAEWQEKLGLIGKSLSSKVWAYEIPNPRKFEMWCPEGSEKTANGNWISGGYTKGGYIPEALIKAPTEWNVRCVLNCN